MNWIILIIFTVFITLILIKRKKKDNGTIPIKKRIIIDQHNPRAFNFGGQKRYIIGISAANLYRSHVNYEEYIDWVKGLGANHLRIWLAGEGPPGNPTQGLYHREQLIGKQGVNEFYTRVHDVHKYLEKQDMTAEVTLINGDTFDDYYGYGLSKDYFSSKLTIVLRTALDNLVRYENIIFEVCNEPQNIKGLSRSLLSDATTYVRSYVESWRCVTSGANPGISFGDYVPVHCVGKQYVNAQRVLSDVDDHLRYGRPVILDELEYRFGMTKKILRTIFQGCKDRGVYFVRHTYSKMLCEIKEETGDNLLKEFT